MAGFAENGGIFSYTEASLRSTLFSTEPPGVIHPNRDGWTVERLEWEDASLADHRRSLLPSSGPRFLQGEGRVQGRLIGGCIEVLDWLRGTSVWPEQDDWSGAILFIETSEEAPSPLAVARMLRSLGALGVLERLSGMIVGRPGGMLLPEEHARFDEEAVEKRLQSYDDAILQVVTHEHGLNDLPIITNMDFGHTDPMFVLPIGVMAEIDCDGTTFAIVESPVGP
jgi:muramoyltetrapeptide carboxypeptidase LdcA involved in peptidoglycan recycling